MTTDDVKESRTVNDSHQPNMCSSMLFAAQHISVVADAFPSTRYVNELNSSSSRLLCSFSFNLLQTCANHESFITKEHSNNIH